MKAEPNYYKKLTIKKEMFEDTKEEIRSRKTNKERQFNA
jgi:hypothetical protein